MIGEYLDGCAPTADTDTLVRLNHHCMKEAIPLNVTIEIMLKCNFRCQHCYNFDRSEAPSKELVSNPLTYDETNSLIEQLSNAGTLNLTFTGGEPLLNPHVYDYIKKTREHHMVPRLKTNGALMTKAVAEKLKESGLVTVDFSLYGASPASHDEFTRSKGTFDAVIRGIKFAKQSVLQPSVNIIIHRGNYHEYPQMVDLLNELEVPFGTSLDISTRNDESTSSLRNRLTKSELQELFKLDYAKGFLEERPFDNLQCGCARTNCGISFKGEVYPCVGAPLYCGSVKDSTFQEVWEKSPQLNWIRNLGNNDFKDCLGCDLRKVCPRNSGVSYSNSGDYTAKDDWSCMTAELIQEARNDQGI